MDCNQGGGWEGTDAGIKMKSTTGWSGGGNGTNESGFTALPSGSYSLDYFNYLGMATCFWSSTEMIRDRAWSWELWYDYAKVLHTNIIKDYGFRVRCVQDLIISIN